MSSLSRKCWTSEFLAACTGLIKCNTFTHCARPGQPVVMREQLISQSWAVGQFPCIHYVTLLSCNGGVCR
eukprot:612801-Pelagomonas_calceolata.AAC.2